MNSDPVALQYSHSLISAVVLKCLIWNAQILQIKEHEICIDRQFQLVSQVFRDSSDLFGNPMRSFEFWEGLFESDQACCCQDSGIPDTASECLFEMARFFDKGRGAGDDSTDWSGQSFRKTKGNWIEQRTILFDTDALRNNTVP